MGTAKRNSAKSAKPSGIKEPVALDEASLKTLSAGSINGVGGQPSATGVGTITERRTATPEQQTSEQRATAAAVFAAAAGHPGPSVTAKPYSGKLVDVNVPKAFNLIDDTHVMHRFEAGEQEMREEFANHFYAKAHGVTILDK